MSLKLKSYSRTRMEWRQYGSELKRDEKATLPWSMRDDSP